MKIYLLPTTLLLLFSCEKDDLSGGEEPAKQYATLEVKVVRCDPSADPFCQATTPLPGAAVYLFENETFRDQGDHVTFTGITDGMGKTTFTLLDKPKYWLTTTLPAPDGRSKKGLVKTPARTASFLEVIFE